MTDVLHQCLVYIMHYDLHVNCESCLGLQHNGLALTPQASCAYAPQKKQRTVDAFAAAVEDVPVQDSTRIEQFQPFCPLQA